MPVPVGGLRARFIRDSLHRQLKASLTSLNWFAGGRQHMPVTFPADPIDPLTEVKLNTIGIAEGNTVPTDWEMGSNLAEHTNSFFIDVFAESETVGLHLSRDIADILQGRMASAGATKPQIDVYDLSLATPSVIFTCQVEAVAIDRAEFTAQPWQRFWYSVSLTLVDFYGDEAG